VLVFRDAPKFAEDGDLDGSRFEAEAITAAIPVE
jgi:hypothetical protein